MTHGPMTPIKKTIQIEATKERLLVRNQRVVTKGTFVYIEVYANSENKFAHRLIDQNIWFAGKVAE